MEAAQLLLMINPSKDHWFVFAVPLFFVTGFHQFLDSSSPED